jgi:nitrate/nitrite transporter NarK
MGLASLFSDLTMPISWDACVEIGGSYTATVAATMNMLGNLAGFVMPVVGGLILQKTAGNWASLIRLMIASDVIAALCWLYLNPERAGRQREQERIQERLNASLNPEGASL